MSALQPHRKRYWLTPPPDDPTQLADGICTVCEAYRATPALAGQGTHVMSTDEMTGIQAPTAPASLLADAARSCRSAGIRIRATWHRCRLIAKLEVATGQVVTPSLGPTRTEADFAAHLAQTIQTDPQAAWIYITDHLNTHQSETLVRLVAEPCGSQQELGIKGKSGHLATMKTRAAFLYDQSHRIRFVYTRHPQFLVKPD